MQSSMNAPTTSLAAVQERASMRQVLAFVTFAVVYYLLAAYAVSLPFPARLPILIWPGHGLALGVLLVAPVRRWPIYLLLVVMATVAVGFDLNATWQKIAASVAVNVAQPLFAASVLQRVAGPSVQIDTVRGLGSLLVGLVLPVAAMSALDAGFTYVHTSAPFKDQWSVIFVSTLLGMLLTAPLILAW